jgi:hypothetical protein
MILCEVAVDTSFVYARPFRTENRPIKFRYQCRLKLCSDDGYGLNANRQTAVASVPFELTIPLPLPLKSGINYRVLPGPGMSKPG